MMRFRLGLLPQFQPQRVLVPSPPHSVPSCDLRVVREVALVHHRPFYNLEFYPETPLTTIAEEESQSVARKLNLRLVAAMRRAP